MHKRCLENIPFSLNRSNSHTHSLVEWNRIISNLNKLNCKLICALKSGLPLLLKAKIQCQFKVFANIFPRIQGFVHFSRFYKLSNIRTITIFFSHDTFANIYFHIYTKQDDFHTVISQC